jgi:hypothetical protein
MIWAGDAASTGEKRNAYVVLMGEPDGTGPQEICKHREEGNVNVVLRKIGWRFWTGFIWLMTETRGGLLLTR